MTPEQQTAATDNALVEKLTREDRPPFYDQGMGAFIHYYRNPDGPEAAERIKSLLAEVERLNAERDIAVSWARGERNQAKADRQRMCDALERAGFMTSEPHNPGGNHPRARKLVIGFENGDDAFGLQMLLATFIKNAREKADD